MKARLTSLVWIASLISLSAQVPAPAGLLEDSRGPIVNTGIVPKASEDGVEAPGYVWKPAPEVSKWTASWIGPSDPDIKGSAADLLRQTVTLKVVPAKVFVYVTSGNYILFVNGHMAARGPADFGHDFAGTPTRRFFYDARDLTPLFHEGKNTLAIELIGRGGFLLQGTVTYPDQTTESIQTDTTWKGERSPFLLKQDYSDKLLKKGNYPVFEADQEPVGWMLPTFDDSKWQACHTGSLPENLTLSELPPLMECRYPFFEVKPGTNPTSVTIPSAPFQPGSPVVFTGDGSFIVHYHRIMSGRISLLIDGVKGTTLLLNSNETASPGGRSYILHLRDGLQTYSTPDYYALGVATVVASGVTKPVSILDLSGESDCQPVSYQGSFTCSDDELNKLWVSTRWSTEICMQTHHLDSPQHQEPIGDYGDYLIADLVTFENMGDNPWLALQDLRKFGWVLENAHYQTFHTSYIFYWLQSLLNYYDYTGDKSAITELAPMVHGLIAQFKTYLGSNGIISQAPNYMFMDWIKINGIACHHPPAVIGQGYMTALYINALVDAKRVSLLTGDNVHAEEYQRLHDQLVIAFNKELWNEKEGMYRDGKPHVTTIPPAHWLPADTDMESFSVQNNTFAVLYDIAPKERQASVIDKMMATSPLNATPYFQHFVFNAINHAGLFDKYGTQMMRNNWKVQPETQTVREMGSTGDFSHGWIASPAFQMPSKILGVNPAAPAFDQITIAPHLCDLTFAKGSVPTPHGLVQVDWQRQPNQLTLKVTFPPGTSGTVEFPPAKGATTVTLGAAVTNAPAQHQDSNISIPIPAAGTYTLVGTGDYGQ